MISQIICKVKCADVMKDWSWKHVLVLDFGSISEIIHQPTSFLLQLQAKKNMGFFPFGPFSAAFAFDIPRTFIIWEHLSEGRWMYKNHLLSNTIQCKQWRNTLQCNASRKMMIKCWDSDQVQRSVYFVDSNFGWNFE